MAWEVAHPAWGWALVSFGALALLLAAHPFVTYPMSLRVLVRLRPRPLRPAPATAPTIALCVCAYNEERVIEAKVENMLAMRAAVPDLEILVYVDAASDRTAEILRGYGAHIQLVAGTVRHGKTHGMNLLVGMTAAELVVFSDANVMFDADAVPRLVAPFADPEVGAVCGHLVYTGPGGNATAETGSRYWRLEERIKALESASGSVMGADGSIFAIRRRLHRPPPPDLIDDMFVSLSVLCGGARIVRAADARAYEESVSRPAEEFRRKIRIACQAFNVHRALRPALRRMPLVDRYKYVSHKLLRWLAIYLLAASAVSVPAGLALAGAPLAAGLLLAVGIAGLARDRDRPARPVGLPARRARRLSRDRDRRCALAAGRAVPDLEPPRLGARRAQPGRHARPRTRRPAGARLMRVAMIDPSLFTPSYDQALASALTGGGPCGDVVRAQARPERQQPARRAARRAVLPCRRQPGRGPPAARRPARPQRGRPRLVDGPAAAAAAPRCAGRDPLPVGGAAHDRPADAGRLPAGRAAGADGARHQPVQRRPVLAAAGARDDRLHRLFRRRHRPHRAGSRPARRRGRRGGAPGRGAARPGLAGAAGTCPGPDGGHAHLHPVRQDQALQGRRHPDRRLSPPCPTRCARKAACASSASRISTWHRCTPRRGRGASRSGSRSRTASSATTRSPGCSRPAWWRRSPIARSTAAACCRRRWRRGGRSSRPRSAASRRRWPTASTAISCRPATPRPWPRAMAHLIEDRGFASACSTRARALSDQGVTWEAIARQTASLYRACGAGYAAAARAPGASLVAG